MNIPPQPKLTPEERKVALNLLSHFKIDGKPADEMATESQVLIFGLIVFKKSPRMQIMCSTQFGKSLFVALAVIVLTCQMAETVAIIAPGNTQAMIIMRYYIEHLGDHFSFLSKLEYEDRNNYNRLRQDKSKSRISLNNGGTIFVLSAQSTFLNKSITAAMGQGAEIVIQDESCLLSDNTEATIFRMISGKGDKGMYVKIGNPWTRNHFWKSWNDSKYLRVFIDYIQGMKEGRYSKEVIDEAREKPFFDILFENKFPPEDEIDQSGYRQIVVSDDLKYSDSAVMDGQPTLGCDIGGGGDWNTYCIRYNHYSFFAGMNKSNDTMTNVTEIISLMEKYRIKDYNVNIDDIGIGRGVVDRLKEMDYNVNGVSVGGKPDEDRFSNIKAQIYWEASQWIKNAKNFLRQNDKWIQLTWIKYKVKSDKTLIIEPKEDLKKRTHQSPDFAEAFALTFYKIKDSDFDFSVEIQS